MFGLAGVLALVATAAEVTVTVVPGAPCVTDAVLTRKLLAAGVNLSQPPSPSTVRVTLQKDGGQLLVLGRRGALRFERRIPASLDDCPAVMRVTVALISAWAATPATETLDGGSAPIPTQTPAPAPAPAETRQAPSSEVVSSRFRPSAPEPSSPREDVVTAELDPDAGSPAPEVSNPDSGIELDAGAAVPLEIVSVDAGSTPTAGTWRLEAAVVGGINAGPSPGVTVAGSVLAGLSLGRWGVLLEGGLESARTARQDPVQVSASLQWISISVRAVFELLSSLTFDVALGARGWRLAARATGVTTAFDQNELTAGPALSAAISWHLAGPLFVHLRPSLAWRAQQFSLKVDPVGQVLLIGPWSVGAALGALLRFE